jgi:hypothetical protein
MRVLIVSNLYPPHYIGGYEIRCAQVAEALQRAGHEAKVITSEYRVARGGEAARRGRREVLRGVVAHRCLREYIFPPWIHLRPWADFRARRELEDSRHFQRVVKAFRPDIVSWWSLYGLSKLLLPQPPRWGIPDVYWIEQSWLIDQVGPGGAIVGRFWPRLLGREVGLRAERGGVVSRRAWPARGFPSPSWRALLLPVQVGRDRAHASAHVFGSGGRAEDGSRVFRPGIVDQPSGRQMPEPSRWIEEQRRRG